jgi:prepilin-type N-terminal cleavage/methylation domain-containing protein
VNFTFRRAFTLVEVIIVVLIIGVLLTIAAPNMARARERSRQKACVSNLRMIESAKEMWAMENKRVTGTYVTLTELIGTYIAGPEFASSTPESRALEFKCPSSGGMYGPTMGVIGTPARCPTPEAQTGEFAHVLP